MKISRRPSKKEQIHVRVEISFQSNVKTEKALNGNPTAHFAIIHMPIECVYPAPKPFKILRQNKSLVIFVK